MKYREYFVLLVFIFTIIGVIFALINNDFIVEQPKYSFLKKNNDELLNEIKFDKDINKRIKEREEELKKSEEERKKKIEEEIKKIIFDSEKKKTEDENKKKKEEEEKRENEEKKKREEEKKKKEEEKKKKEEEEKKKKKEEANENKNKEQEKFIEIAKSQNIHKFTEDGKIRIACAYALDNTYVFPTLVAMTSLAENAAKKTFYDIYVMVGTGFTEENQKILLSVEEKHKEHCKVYFIDMADKFAKADSNKKITTPTYYRLELSSLLPDVNRIIWMDGDTAVFEDLTELITIDMKHYYIMGFLDSLPNAIERFGVKDATVLCAGVLLLDLDALRKNHMQEKMYQFINDNLGKLNQHDKHNERQRPWLKYNKDEFVHAYYHPAILHYVWPKPFWKRQKPVFNKEWWEYARISGYYNDVYNKSPKWISNRLLTELAYEINHYHYHYI